MVKKSVIELKIRDSLRDSLNTSYPEKTRAFLKIIHNRILKPMYLNMGSREKMRDDTFFKKFTETVNKELLTLDKIDGDGVLFLLSMYIPSFDYLVVSKTTKYLNKISEMARLYDAENYWDVGIEKAMELMAY